MATISENLQTIKNSTDAIKQAIIDKGGTIEGDITTWASAINGIETGGGGGSSDEEYTFTGTISYNMMEATITGSLNKIPDTGRNDLLVLGQRTGGVCYDRKLIESTGPYTLTLDFDEPVSTVIPAICILSKVASTSTVIPVTFFEQNTGGGHVGGSGS